MTRALSAATLALGLAVQAAWAQHPHSRGADTAATKAAVLAAEQALIADSRARGPEALLGVLEPGAAVLVPGHPILRAEESRAALTARYGGASSYTWEPVHAVASLDGNLGCTVGYSHFVNASDTAHAVHGGAYQTCWRKGVDGAWRVIAIARADAPPQFSVPEGGHLRLAPHSATVSFQGDPRTETQDTDSAFARFAADSGVGLAFSRFAAPDVVGLLAGAYGPAEIFALFTEYTGHWTIDWGPMRTFGAASGGLGFDVGHATTRRIDGGQREIKGKFMTIWRQNADGTWSYIFDMGNSRP